MHRYFKEYLLIDHACRMSCFSRGIHGQGKGRRGNWN
jgi:hypothetical protein